MASKKKKKDNGKKEETSIELPRKFIQAAQLVGFRVITKGTTRKGLCIHCSGVFGDGTSIKNISTRGNVEQNRQRLLEAWSVSHNPKRDDQSLIRSKTPLGNTLY